MNYYSYIDTALRVIHINRKNEGEVERVEKLNDLLQSLKSSREFKSHFINENIKYNLQSPEVSTLLVHESHHYWQSIFYPYLFYINFLEYHSLCAMRLQLVDYPEKSIRLGSLRVHPKIDHNLRYCSDKFRYSWNDENMLQVTDKDITEDQKFDPDVFCLDDLIEDATTIFQFKATVTSSNAESYFDWIQNPSNKGYKKLYKFLVRRFSKAYAYHFIPILVQLSFHTTEPISMFMNLVNITIHHGMFDGEYATWDYSLMKEFLKGYIDPVDFNVPATFSINDMPVGFITHAFFQQIVDYAYSNIQSVHYPLSVHAKKHLLWVRESEQREETLLHINSENFKELLERYFPFAIHFNFLDQDARNTGLLLGSPDFNKVIVNGHTLDYEYIIKEQLNMQDTTMNLFYGLHRETPHQCSHENCPYYSMLLCTKWNSIPKDFVNCRFPHWFPIHYGYKLIPKENSLQRISTEELLVFEEKFKKLFKEFSHDKFRYLFKDNLVTLQIGKDIINANDYTYIIEFVEKILKETSLKDLGSTIILEFDQHTDDDRQVFEIPEILDYMKEVYKRHPSFFYFLNFDPEFRQGSYIFPMYVDHTHTPLPNGAFNVLLNHDAYMKFMKELAYVIGIFANQEKLELTTILERFFKHLLK